MQLNGGKLLNKLLLKLIKLVTGMNVFNWMEWNVSG